MTGHGVVVDTADFATTIPHSTKISSLIPRHCQLLKLDMKVRLIAEECAERLETDGYPGLAGRNPSSVAAAVIFFISHFMGTPRRPKDIGDAMGLAAGTIRKAYEGVFAQVMTKGSNIDKVMGEWIEKGGHRDQIPPTSGKV